MQIMQISSLTMYDTKMYEADSDSTEKNWPRMSHKINYWLIIGTGMSLPNIMCCGELNLTCIPS